MRKRKVYPGTAAAVENYLEDRAWVCLPCVHFWKPSELHGVDRCPQCHEPCVQRVMSTPEQPAEDTPHGMQSDEEEGERLLITEMMRRLK